MKKVIIIGATSGIGRALAILYARNGYIVGITGRRIDLLVSLQKKFPKKIFIENFDVTGKENIPHFQSLIEQMDGFDIFIFSSGYSDISKELDYDIEKQTVNVNVNGFLELINYAFNYLVNQGQGQLAVISSVAGLRGNSWAPAYNASKAFQQNYLEGLKIKIARLNKNISITDIRPGYVDTPMAKGDAKFWMATPEEAATDIFAAISKRKQIAYITKRWWWVAKIISVLPYWLYKKIS